jgi:hypothetical protein
MAASRDLLTGIAQMIEDTSIGVFNPTGVYGATDTAIIFKNMPSKPDRVITLTAVPLTDMTMIPVGKMLVQVRTRGLPNNPLDVDDLGDAIFDLLHGLTNVTMGSTHIIQCLRNSSVPMGVDNSQRFERVDHFYIDMDYPGTVNRPEIA